MKPYSEAQVGRDYTKNESSRQITTVMCHMCIFYTSHNKANCNLFHQTWLYMGWNGWVTWYRSFFKCLV